MVEKYYPEGSPEGRAEALRRIAEARSAGKEELDLGGLGLTEVPVELFDLAQLKVLYLGLLPEAANKDYWERSQEDKKACNAVSALPAAFFTSLRRLTHLHLESNQLESLPDAIGQLTALQKLWLGNNQLESLPDAIGQLTALVELRLDSNQLESLPDAIGQLTALLELSLENNQLESLPDAIGRLTALQTLWLGSNQLGSLPDAIGRLTALQTLWLANNQLESLPDAIGQITALQTLWLDYNQLGSLPDVIWQLTALRLLGLGANQLGWVPDAIGQLTALERLSLSANQLGSLPDAIGQLTALQKLWLGNNQLECLPDAIGQLTALEELRLDSNQLGSLPDTIGQLTALEELRLDSNQLGSLPDAIGQLTALQTLSLANNQLESLPDAIGQLTALQNLWLENNQLESLPDAIGQLTALEELRLDSNQLGRLPDTIGQLTALQTLWLDSNQLGSLPLCLANLDRLRGKDAQGQPRFTVADNPLPPLPSGLTADSDAVLDFLKGLAEGPEPCNEVKTVLVGEGKAGKTSLLHRLTDNEFIPNRPETLGLEIGCYDLEPPDGEGHTLHLNVWDFGGQDDYRSTQQFFFTPQALYVFLWNRRFNVDASNVRRWLSLVNKRAGSAKVLMIATHCFEGGKSSPHLFKAQDIARLDKQFPGMLLPGVLEIDSADPPYHIDELKARLYAEANDVHGRYNVELPSKWVQARNKVLARNTTHMDFADFEADCAACGVTGGAVRSLLNMLALQGRLVNYGADPKLRDVVVLNAEWLMKAFASVRRDRCEPPEAFAALPNAERPARNRAGFLHRDRLAYIWKEYPRDKHDLLLRLMIRHGLSYAITDDEWLIPELVPSEQPDLPWDDLNGDHNPSADQFSHRPLVQYCQFGTEYDDEHDLDIIPGLIAVITQRSSYYFTKPNWFWQEGLFLQAPTGTEALITLPKARLLRIETRGRYLGDMMTELRGVVEQVVRERWLAARNPENRLYEFLVPCHEDRCEAKYFLNTLLEIEREEGAGAMMPCPRGHKHSVSQLLRGVRPPEAPEWAEKLGRKIHDGFEKLDRRLNILDQVRQELGGLLENNADVKQCLNFLIAATTAPRPPRLYHLQPLNFDLDDPKPILGPALRPSVVRMTVWCEWEHRPVPEAYVDIPVDTKLGGYLRRNGKTLLKTVTAAIAVKMEAAGFQLVAGAKLNELLEFMQGLVKSAPDDMHRALREKAVEEGANMLVMRHEAADEADAEFAGLLRDAAKKGGMVQMLLQDGHWRWVSKEAALRLDPAEPRPSLGAPPVAAIAERKEDVVP